MLLGVSSIAVSFLNHYLKYCSVRCKILIFFSQRILKCKKKIKIKKSNLLQAKNCDSNSILLKLKSNPTEADWRLLNFSLMYQD